MIKKLVIVVAVFALLIWGVNKVSSALKPASAQTQTQTQTTQTTSAPTLLEQMNAIKQELSAFEDTTNGDLKVINAKIDQILSILQKQGGK